jgi:pyruvate kinase
MIARGDLGVEIPIEEVPIVQKMIIEKANKVGKTVITATQMLESMISNVRPTRAEVTDIANAIFDGTDAIMLSGETAKGKYPIESLRIMARVAETAEKTLNYESILKKKSKERLNTIPDAICFAAVKAANELNASGIITVTHFGYTAKIVSKYWPKCPIIAATFYEDVARSLSIVRGVYPIIISKMEPFDQVINSSVKAVLERGLVSKGDIVIFVGGKPNDRSEKANMMRILIVGDEDF